MLLAVVTNGRARLSLMSQLRCAFICNFQKALTRGKSLEPFGGKSLESSCRR